MLQSRTILVASTAQSEAGEYLVTVIATSIENPNFVLSGSFKVTVKSSNYPSFRTALESLTVFRGNSFTYHIPDLINLSGYTYEFKVVTGLPSFIRYDTSSRNL
jgi:hypothetical protein